MLKGKIAVVTGASRGIGRAIAVKLAAEGAVVIINYNRSKDEAEKVKEQIEASGGQVKLIQCNVASFESCEKMFEEVMKEFGRIDKQNITDFSVPSILWGIDGDWMVNIVPANKPFYPTDHCGVLRIKTDDIVPKYMALALQVEGEFERFSRSNRASTQRISNLIIQVPSVAEQQKIVDEIEAIDKKITDEQAIISEQSNKVKSKFVEMFGDVSDNNLLSDYCAIEKGSNITRDEVVKGKIPVIAGGISPSCYHNESNREADIITVSASGANAGYLNYWSIPIFASDCNTIQSLDNKKLLNIYLYYYLLKKQDYIYSLQRGSGQPHVYGKDLEKIKITIPPIELQNQFADYAKTCDKLKFEVEEFTKITYE